jgi:hypothetical protein
MRREATVSRKRNNDKKEYLFRNEKMLAQEEKNKPLFVENKWERIFSTTKKI